MRNRIPGSVSWRVVLRREGGRGGGESSTPPRLALDEDFRVGSEAATEAEVLSEEEDDHCGEMMEK